MPKIINGDSIKQTFGSFDGSSSSYYILQKASDVDGFLKWLRENHSIEVTEKLFAGYKFLLGSIFKIFLNEVYHNTLNCLRAYH